MRTEVFPPLYALASTGKVKEWSIVVEEHAPNAVDIIVSTGYIDGKKTSHTTTVTKGKNIGKKNETTPWEQALSDAQSKWNLKKNRQGHTEEIPSAVTATDEKAVTTTGHARIESMLPMLAKMFDLEKHRKKNVRKGINFPAAAQPKYDGIRAVVRVDNPGSNAPEVHLFSRKGLEITNVPHINSQIVASVKKWKPSHQYEQVWLDGELFTTALGFETISGLTRRKDISNETSEEQAQRLKIQFWMFDMFVPAEPGMTFRERWNLVESFPIHSNILEKVPVFEVKDVEAILPLFERFVKENYEGIILRNWDSPYAVGLRSSDLQKYKPFEDAEFPIVGFTEGDGDEKGLVLWDVVIPASVNPKGAGRMVRIRPRGTHEERARLFREAQEDFEGKFKGKLLTVRFDGWTKDHSLRDPRGIDIRWDLP